MLRFFRSRDTEYSDEELLRSYQSGGEIARLGQLYERYAELVYGLCLKYLHHEQEAEDAAMDIFEQLVAKARAHDIHNFKSWLYVLAKNHCLMQLRKSNRYPTENTEPAFMQIIGLRHHTTEEGEENGQMHHLEDCLSKLPAKQKECIRAFYLEGLSYREISEARGESLGIVRSYIQNGRRNLRTCMEKKKAGDLEKK